MPFITEELFQRLPRADLQIKSICVAAYPELCTFNFKNEGVEKEFDFILKAAKELRSARSDYNIPNKTKTDAYVVCEDTATKLTINRFLQDLATLSYSSKVEISTPPSGCAIYTVSAQCEIHLLLKGIIEADKEIAKLQKKKEFLVQSVSKLNQLAEAADYSTKVPIEVQAQNSDKLEQSKIEIERITAAIQALAVM